MIGFNYLYFLGTLEFVPLLNIAIIFLYRKHQLKTDHDPEHKCVRHVVSRHCALRITYTLVRIDLIIYTCTCISKNCIKLSPDKTKKKIPLSRQVLHMS